MSVEDLRSNGSGGGHAIPEHAFQALDNVASHEDRRDPRKLAGSSKEVLIAQHEPRYRNVSTTPGGERSPSHRATIQTTENEGHVFCISHGSNIYKDIVEKLPFTYVKNWKVNETQNSTSLYIVKQVFFTCQRLPTYESLEHCDG